jgi:competence protein ComEA
MRRSTDLDPNVVDRFRRVIGLPEDPSSFELPDEAPPAAPPSRGAHRSVLRSLDPGRHGALALLAVGAVVVCIAAFLAWQARPHPVSVPAAPPPTAVAPAVSASPAMLVIAVSGRVTRPGLVRLPSGSRVADAIDAAGGALPGTDLSSINLARKVVDGELIAVGITPPPAAAPGGGPAAAGGPVNLNTATLADLETLPGVGEVLGQRILDYRTQHGQFRSVTDLRQVSGIGDAKFASLKDKVTV